MDEQDGFDGASGLQVDETGRGRRAAICQKGEGFLRAHLPVVRPDIDEGGPCAAIADGIGGRDEGDGGHHDLVIQADSGLDQGDVQGGGAGIHRHRERRAGCGDEQFLEFLDVRADVGHPVGVEGLDHVGLFPAG